MSACSHLVPSETNALFLSHFDTCEGTYSRRRTKQTGNGGPRACNQRDDETAQNDHNSQLMDLYDSLHTNIHTPLIK